MQTYDCVLQYPWARLQAEGFPYRGKWREAFFHNSNPITLELGCGKGEYTVALARKYPDRNFIGIDIKGARMWTGASQAVADGLINVAFLRSDIELIENFFAPGEVNEIWITFPDPQMQKQRKRLTSTRFLKLYRQIAIENAPIRLKTDSPFLFAYTMRLLDANPMLKVRHKVPDLYASQGLDEVKEVKTFYEQQWLARGKTIKYLDFLLSAADLTEVDDSDIERDDYHSYPRGIAQRMPDEIEKLNKIHK